MSNIKNKIDFAVIFTVENANPNGDPLDGNRPRMNCEGRGEVSDVCIKRKIRNRWQDLGEDVFVQSDDRKTDGAKSLKDRAKTIIESAKTGKGTDSEKLARDACGKWIDVRAFGQLFAFSGDKKEDGDDKGGKKDPSISVGIRGPVSVRPAFSLSPVSVSSIQITKSVNSEGDGKKSSDTMGMKHRVNHGTYVFYGSISPQLATKTGFSDEDATALLEALKTLFHNDSSAARPDGSMDVREVYWWVHNIPNGQYSSRRVHESLVVKDEGIGVFSSTVSKLEGLEPEVFKI
jgi:CRISPR-associated protein Csd2